MPLLKDIKLPVTVKVIVANDSSSEIIQNEDSMLLVKGICTKEHSGVSIANKENKIILESTDTHSSFTHSVFVTLNEVCKINVIYGRLTRREFESDIFEIQFTGNLSGIIIPTGIRGLNALHKKSKGEDISSVYGYKMELKAFGLYRCTSVSQSNHVIIERK